MKVADVQAIRQMDPSNGIYLQVVQDAEGEHLSITEPQGCWGKFMIWLGFSSASLSKVTKYITEHQEAFAQADTPIRDRLMSKIERYIQHRWTTNRVAELALKILQTASSTTTIVLRIVPDPVNDLPAVLPPATPPKIETIDLPPVEALSPRDFRSELGNHWFLNDIQKHLKGFSDEDTAAYAVVYSACKKQGHYDLARLFPQRGNPKELVRQLTAVELLQLPAVEYMAILDLLSGEQSLAILREKSATTHRKMALYQFNLEIGSAFCQVLRNLVNQRIDECIVQVAQQAFTSYPKYDADQMRAFQATRAYMNLDHVRKMPSVTLWSKSQMKPKPGVDAQRWETVNKRYLVDEMDLIFTLKFFTQLNNQLRAEINGYTRPEVAQGSFRKTAQEVFIEIADATFHTCPGREVEKVMNYYVAWINSECNKCKNGKKNPIVIAALAWYFFVSIHPYIQGNGRTARMLADIILRYFKLLPIAWGDKLNRLKIFNIQAVDEDCPNDAVRCVLKGLEESYQLASQNIHK